MLLRLSPNLVRPFGHAVHRAPETERKQHPGYGATGHAVWNNGLSHDKVTGVPCSDVYFTTDGNTYIPGGLLLSCAAPPLSPNSTLLSVQRPLSAGYQAVGVIYLGMAWCQPEEGRPKKPSLPHAASKREARDINRLRNIDVYAHSGS